MAGIARRETLSIQVIKELSNRISTGQYRRGDKLPTEQDLIVEFNVSRTVIREAIANLKATGLVETRQGVGAFVLNALAPNAFRIQEDNLQVVEEIISVMELRLSIELEVAALAAARRTDLDLKNIRAALDLMRETIPLGESSIQADLEFHRTIAIATKNKHFVSIFNYLGEVLIPRARMQTHRLNGDTQQEYLQRINSEHEQIYRAIESQDADAARSAMRLHLGGSRDRLRARMQTAAQDETT